MDLRGTTIPDGTTMAQEKVLAYLSSVVSENGSINSSKTLPVHKTNLVQELLDSDTSFVRICPHDTETPTPTPTPYPNAPSSKASTIQEEEREFKHNVSEWRKLDIEVKRLQHAITERKKKQKQLEEHIKCKMLEWKVEDLNGKIDVISLKTKNVKKKLPYKQMKEELYKHFGKDDDSLDKIKQIIEPISVSKTPYLSRHQY